MYKKLFFAIAALVLFATSAQAQQNKGPTVLDALSSLSAGGNTIGGPFPVRFVTGVDTIIFDNGIAPDGDYCVTYIVLRNPLGITISFSEANGPTVGVPTFLGPGAQGGTRCQSGVSRIRMLCDADDDCVVAARIDRL